MKTLVITKYLLLALLLVLAGITSPAKAEILVSSSESHSIERFSNNGTWVGTFATTGPRTPYGIAVSPVTKDVFVATMTGTILRYQSDGRPAANWDTFNTPPDNNPVESILFDAAGNLWVATYFGESGYVANLYKYQAPVNQATPVLIDTIPTDLRRGNQMAFDRLGNLCVVSYFNTTVRCFNPNTHKQTFDYNAELVASGIGPPGGLAFDAQNRLYVSGAFNGGIGLEQAQQLGPIGLQAKGLMIAPSLLFLTLDGTDIYVPSFHNADARMGYCLLGTKAAAYACNDYDFSSDIIYKVNANGVTKFIASHIWGPYQLIFRDDPCRRSRSSYGKFRPRCCNAKK